jgi:hypothetical protein
LTKKLKKIDEKLAICAENVPEVQTSKTKNRQKV